MKQRAQGLQLGDARLSDVRLIYLQEFVDAMVADGLSASTIDVTLNPLRAIYRRALARGFVAVNPTQGLELPANRGRRNRIASPDEAQKLLAALPERDRPIWATALYAGLRRGELMALDWSHIDLASGLIRVARSWDDVEGLIGLKTKAGKRNVPIPAVLRDYLDEHRLRSDGTGLAFGDEGEPFNPKTLTERADRAWRGARLERIILHECRHTFASLMIAAGVNAKALQSFMGHSSITTTLDTYGHLMPGSEDEAANLLDAYLEVQRQRAEEVARAAGAELTEALTGAPTGAPVAHGV
jgi:integrase